MITKRSEDIRLGSLKIDYISDVKTIFRLFICYMEFIENCRKFIFKLLLMMSLAHNMHAIWFFECISTDRKQNLR